MTGLVYIDAAMTEAGAHSWAMIPAAPVDALHSAIYHRYIAERRHGSMSWAARFSEVRDDPRLLFRDQDGPPVAALLIALFAYPPAEQATALRFRGVPYVADYALAPTEYHFVIRKQLQPVAALISGTTGATTRIYCDTAPLRERYWAARAGLGFITRNNQFNVPGQGSSFHIAVVAIGGDGTSAHIYRSRRRLLPPPVSPCPADCTRCITACPTHALRSDGSCDASRCLSYLTIEAPAPQFPLHVVSTSLINKKITVQHVYGCDVCRHVCPFSVATASTPLPISELRPTSAMQLTRESWLKILPSDFRKLLPRNALQRPGLKRLRRNL